MNILKKTLEKEAEKFIKESSQRIPKILESATLSLLGLERNYNGTYEIDHCNGRNSVLIEAFKRLAQTEAEKIAKSYKPTSEDLVNFKVAFEKEYKQQMSYIIRDLARDKAKADATDAINKIKLDIEKIIADSVAK